MTHLLEPMRYLGSTIHPYMYVYYTKEKTDNEKKNEENVGLMLDQVAQQSSPSIKSLILSLDPPDPLPPYPFPSSPPKSPLASSRVPCSTSSRSPCLFLFHHRRSSFASSSATHHLSFPISSGSFSPSPTPTTRIPTVSAHPLTAVSAQRPNQPKMLPTP